MNGDPIHYFIDGHFVFVLGRRCHLLTPTQLF